MQNASVFAKEEKISMTKVAQMLESAQQMLRTTFVDFYFYGYTLLIQPV